MNTTFEQKTNVSGEWRTIPVPEGSAFYAYHPSLVHPDFNPWGVVEAVHNGEEVMGAVWNGCQDCWDTVPIDVALWRPISGPYLAAPALNPSEVRDQALSASEIDGLAKLADRIEEANEQPMVIARSAARALDKLLNADPAAIKAADQQGALGEKGGDDA